MNSDRNDIESKRGLTQFILFSRKWKACNEKRRIRFMSGVPQILANHGIDSDTILSNSIDPKSMSPAVFEDVLNLFPSDKTLRLKDTVYESRFVAIPRSQNPEKTTKSRSKRRKKISLNLLQIPTDIQCHVLQFLKLKQLFNVQETCRALCLAARNPKSLYFLDICETDTREMAQWTDEFYSQPTILKIDEYVTVHGNPNWSQRVRELTINGDASLQNTPPFEGLRVCNLRTVCKLRTGTKTFDRFESHIHSYETLSVLVLENIILTEEFVVYLEKFQNLQELRLAPLLSAAETRPISLNNLKSLHFKSDSRDDISPILERILIGSHPETVHIDTSYLYIERPFLILSDSAPSAIRSIKSLHVNDDHRLLLHSIHSVIQKTHWEQSKLFEEAVVTVKVVPRRFMQSSVMTVLRSAKKSTLKLLIKLYELDGDRIIDLTEMIHQIITRGGGLITEIEVDITHDVFDSDSETEVINKQLVLHSISDSNRRKESTSKYLKSVATKSIDQGEKWMYAWLAFDTTIMKRIGIKKIGVNFKSFINPDAWDVCNGDQEDKWHCFDCAGHMAAEFMKQRAGRWSAIDQRCTTVFEEKRNEDYIKISSYTVNLTLES